MFKTLNNPALPAKGDTVSFFAVIYEVLDYDFKADEVTILKNGIAVIVNRADLD